MYNKNKYYKKIEVNFRITKNNASIFENNLDKLTTNRKTTEIITAPSEERKLLK